MTVKRNIRVVIWGFGAMGSGMARMLMDKRGVEIVGVCDVHPDRTGRSVVALLAAEHEDGRCSGRDVIVRDRIETVLEEAAADGPVDVALLATDSFTRDAFDKIMLLLSHGMNVITTAEQMAFPSAAEPELAQRMDAAAREAGVTVLGTGINPGLIMDLLVVMLSGACTDITSVRAERINSLSPYGPTVMTEQGVGLSPEAFAHGVRQGTIAGHVGFQESIAMIASAVGWTLSGPVEERMEPIVSSVARHAPHAEVHPGDVAGCTMTGRAVTENGSVIEMVHPQQVEPHAEGTETADAITIQGSPSISLRIQPEVPGGIGTIAMCVNMIPLVLGASPGLKTMLDLPVPRAVLGDMRAHLPADWGR